MKLHAEIGYRMIQCHTSPETAQMVLYHHEDYDGGGYFGLQGNDIPYGARILRICDVYDALTSFRCYREPCSPEKALQYLSLIHIYGTWFGDGTVNKDRGALQYGTYSIRELACKGNYGKDLIETTVTVDSEKTNVSLNPQVNHTIVLKTTAKDTTDVYKRQG